MVYKSLGLATLLAVILFLVAMVIPRLAVPIGLYIVILTGLAGLVVMLEVVDRLSRWRLYRRYILRTSGKAWNYLRSGPLLFVHACLIMLAPTLLVLAAPLPYLISFLVVISVVAASQRHSESLSVGDVSNLSGALAVVVAMFAISLTMLPMYVILVRNAFCWLRVTQSRHLKGKFTFNREELSYSLATWRLFKEAQEIKSRGCAKKVLDGLRSGTREGYKYGHRGRTVVVEFSPLTRAGFTDGLCYAFYLVTYKPHYLKKVPWGERGWWHLFASLNSLVGVLVLVFGVLTIYTLALEWVRDLVASFVGIYFPQ